MPRKQSSFFDPSILRATRQEDTVSCTECGCQWMELIQVFQFPEYHSVILGQKPRESAGPFYLFRCPKCKEVFEPSVQAGTRDSQRAGYDQFVEHMQKDLNIAPQGEDV